MWVGIFGVWLAVGCPAGVAYSDNFLCIFFGEDAFEGADVVYAKNYVALDLLPPVTDKPEKDEMMKLFNKHKNWIADEKRMNLAKPTAQYMHCLPCERGAEVSDAVLDGKWGEACFNEAVNRLHAQKGVMACIIPLPFLGF